MTGTKEKVKVALSTGLPFYLAHGGFQTMIEAIADGLKDLGVEVCHDAWWHSELDADVIHYFGRPPAINVRMAREKGYKTVFTDVLDATASRSRMALLGQKMLIKTIKYGLRSFAERFAWDVYHSVDAYVTIVPHEVRVAQYLFGVAPDRCHTIPHGLETDVLNGLKRPQGPGDYLFSLATIDPRKNTLELARLARARRIPVVFAGKPYADNDYYQAFMAEVDDVYVRYAGFVSEEEKMVWMRGARGFVLLSEYESGCVAVFEAAAAGLPLLLSDKPWATEAYPSSGRIRYADIHRADAGVALKAFYEESKRNPGEQTFPVYDWQSIAEEYAEIYRELLRNG